MPSPIRKRSRKPRKNPSTVVLVGGGVAALAVAVGAWWFLRGRTADDRLLEGKQGGGGKRKFSPASLKARPSLKAFTATQAGTQGATADTAPVESTSSGTSLVGAMPPSAPGASSYFYMPPTR